MTRYVRSALAGAVVVLGLVPATALAAPPTVKTKNATNVAQTTATLNGTVNPRGNRTFSFFQYGTTKLYGAQTPEVDRGTGNDATKMTADIAGLQPFATYHYRAVAQHGQKLVFGEDRTFKTKKQPLGVTLVANPPIIKHKGETTISGTISGTDAGGQQVVLQSNPYPFPGFQDVGNPQVADSAGNFAFNVIDLPISTAFRVRLPERPNVVSPEIGVNVRIKVTTKVKRRVRKGTKVKFAGTVIPAQSGVPVLIQRMVRGQWVTWKRTKSDSTSRYRAKVRVWKKSKWRVLATPSAAYLADASPTKTIRVFRKR